MPRPRGTPKSGGRKKGSVNRATAAKAKAIAESGLTPLDFMLDLLRDEEQPPHIRLDAAKSSAPYVHPRLSAIEHTGKGGGPVEVRAVPDDRLECDIGELEGRLAAIEGRKIPSLNGTATALPHLG